MAGKSLTGGGGATEQNAAIFYSDVSDSAACLRLCGGRPSVCSTIYLHMGAELALELEEMHLPSLISRLPSAFSHFNYSPLFMCHIMFQKNACKWVQCFLVFPGVSTLL